MTPMTVAQLVAFAVLLSESQAQGIGPEVMFAKGDQVVMRVGDRAKRAPR